MKTNLLHEKRKRPCLFYFFQNSDKDDKSFEFLEIANKKCEWALRFYFKWVAALQSVSYPLIGFSSMLLCFYFHGELQRDYLYVPFNFILLWNQSTPLGYSGEICVYLVFVVPYFIIQGVFFLIFISMSFHHQAFYEMFRHLVINSFGSNDKDDCNKRIKKIIEFQISTRK